MNNSIIVAKATEQVLAPKAFTGKLLNVIPLTRKDENGNVLETYLSYDIEGLPELFDENGRKATVLRTVKQAVSDLRFFSRKGATVQEVELALMSYAVGQDITLNISAHTAGAKFEVTAESNYAKERGGDYKVGEHVTLNKPGFYVDGFANIAFDKTDLVNKLNQLEQNAAKATTKVNY